MARLITFTATIFDLMGLIFGPFFVPYGTVSIAIRGNMFITIEVVIFVGVGFTIGYITAALKYKTNQYRMLCRLDQWRKNADLHERVIK
ncbi:hypothetical protein ACV5Z5_004646 [Salmonella enterica subsp. enterica]